MPDHVISHGEAYEMTKGTDQQASVDGRSLEEASWRKYIRNPTLALEDQGDEPVPKPVPAIRPVSSSPFQPAEEDDDTARVWGPQPMPGVNDAQIASREQLRSGLTPWAQPVEDTNPAWPESSRLALSFPPSTYSPESTPPPAPAVASSDPQNKRPIYDMDAFKSYVDKFASANQPKKPGIDWQSVGDTISGKSASGHNPALDFFHQAAADHARMQDAANSNAQAMGQQALLMLRQPLWGGSSNG